MYLIEPSLDYLDYPSLHYMEYPSGKWNELSNSDTERDLGIMVSEDLS